MLIFVPYIFSSPSVNKTVLPVTAENGGILRNDQSNSYVQRTKRAPLVIYMQGGVNFSNQYLTWGCIGK